MNLQVFQSPEFGQVRTTTYNGEIAFVAKDVLERLGYSENTTASRQIQHVPDKWKGMYRIHTPSGEQEMWVLTEQGLYFFLARSNKPLAIPFQKWIAGEVVPSIRKYGGYLTPPTIDELLDNPDMIIQMATRMKEERQARQLAERHSRSVPSFEPAESGRCDGLVLGDDGQSAETVYSSTAPTARATVNFPASNSTHTTVNPKLDGRHPMAVRAEFLTV